MHKRLKWNAIGLENKTQILLEKIIEDKKAIPKENLKIHRSIDGYIKELSNIINRMKEIREKLTPKLENIFRLEFKTPEMIMLALSRPSIRNIFQNLQTHFMYTNNPLKLEEYEELASSGDAGNVLALIGDSVIDLGVVQSFWDSSLSTSGKLTEKRKEIVSNENLARICDKWGLCDYRLRSFREPTPLKAKYETIIHKKATLVEAIYGVIYLEFGFEELVRTLPILQ